MKSTAWLVPLVGLGAAGMGLALWATRAREAQRLRAWGVTRQVIHRLQTEAGARELFGRNPELGARFGSEAAFLQAVGAHRGAFPEAPEAAPDGTYRCQPGLTAFVAQVQGTDGSWLELEVQGPSLLDQVRGEGLHGLRFAPDREGLRHPSAAEADAEGERDWTRFLAVVDQLGTSEGTRRLWEGEPGLRTTYPRSGDLEAWAEPQRLLLRGIPRGSWARRVKASHGTQRGPEGETIHVDFPMGLRKLRMAWREGRLIFLGLVGPGGD
ncbi:MAG TPA: hypothetical protein VJ570_02735 [Holophagaceae bacterium]|nr:hypothetical protein [Holophagaceae bacterium]